MVKVYCKDKKWILEFSGRAKEYDIRAIAVNRGHFEARGLRESIEIYDCNGKLVEKKDYS